MSPLLLLLAFFFSLVFAVPIVPRDVWVPPITCPNADTVWVVGNTYDVVWDTSTEPSQVTNPTGQVFLRHDGATDVDHPLAQGFQLTDGSVSVTIPPDTIPADDWIIVLMGDSGNWSPPFRIQSA